MVCLRLTRGHQFQNSKILLLRPLLYHPLVLKLLTRTKKSESKLFILRNVELSSIETPENMRSLLIEKLGQDLVAKEPGFEMGYFRSNKRVWVRNQDDVKEVVKRLSKDNHCFTLWCMGKSMSKRVIELSDSDSDGGLTIPQSKRKKSSKYSEKLERIDDTVDELQSEHGSTFTAIQYRVWAETIDADAGIDNPPKGSFFKSQGWKGASTPPASSANTASVKATLTPGKIANLHSTYIQQFKELHSLWEIGAITKEHYLKQRDILLQQMEKLKCYRHS